MEEIIKISHLSAAYDEKTVLHDVSLSVMADDYLGIIGPNGGGKTTLVKLILGMMKPTRGAIAFFRQGQAVEGLNIGYLPQYSRIDRQFPISVYEVVLSGLNRHKPLFHPFQSEHHRHVQETLAELQLDSLGRQPISNLSGGQLQRVLLARAIVSRPELLILDEPNTYIDRRFQAQMYQILERLNRHCAIIVVSHDIAAILRNAKHIACVNHSLHYHSDTNIPVKELETHFLTISST